MYFTHFKLIPPLHLKLEICICQISSIPINAFIDDDYPIVRAHAGGLQTETDNVLSRRPKARRPASSPPPTSRGSSTKAPASRPPCTANVTSRPSGRDGCSCTRSREDDRRSPVEQLVGGNKVVEKSVLSDRRIKIALVDKHGLNRPIARQFQPLDLLLDLVLD